MIFDDVVAGGQLRVGSSICPAAGEGLMRMNGTAHIEGPAVFGNSMTFPYPNATVMIASCTNPDALKFIKPIPGTMCPMSPRALTHSLCVSGNIACFDQLDCGGSVNAGGNIVAQGEVMSMCGGHFLSAKKNFDIPHPTKEGYRLRHTCPEGPSNDVYYRGKVSNKKEIELPNYWEELVDETSITVNLTPIGAHQDVIVKRIGDNKVYLQSRGGMPINCFFHIYGTRTDGERLIPEYQGESPEDYPGDNSQYSISGYHYDVKEES